MAARLKKDERFRKERLHRIKIPVPNPALGEWLKGRECQSEVEQVTAEILSAYQNALPQPGSVSPKGYVRKGKLKRGAYMYTRLSDDWGMGERWFGYVGNKVLYARVIEYGSSKRNMKGQGQLRRAVAQVTGDLRAAAGVATGGMSDAAGFNNPLPPGITYNAKAKRYQGPGGRFVKNPNKR